MKYDLQIIDIITTDTLKSFLFEVENKKSLSIYLHSAGGDGQVAFAIRDFILSNNINVTIHTSCCESAATIILSACKTKIASKNCIFMFHKGSFDNPSEYKYPRKLELINDIYQKIYPSIEMTDEKKYFTSKEMLKMKYINKII